MWSKVNRSKLSSRPHCQPVGPRVRRAYDPVSGAASGPLGPCVLHMADDSDSSLHATNRSLRWLVWTDVTGDVCCLVARQGGKAQVGSHGVR
jgi:hypothetical protein